jgi:phenylacetate-CoA ligase
MDKMMALDLDMKEKVYRPFNRPTPGGVRAFIESVPLYHEDDDPSFWPDERLFLQRNQLLQRQSGWLEQASPYYRAKFKQWGLHSQDIQTLDDLAKVPVTTKADLMADPAQFRLRFEHPSIYDQTYARVYTSGTTGGHPTPYEYTSHDYLGVLLAGRRTFKLQYAQPGDQVFSVFPLSPLPHVAMFSSPIANAAGVSYLSGMTGPAYTEFPVHRSSTSVLDQIEQVRPQILTGITSYVRRLLQDAVKQGRDLSSIYMLQVSGETITASMRQKMHTSLAACGAEQVFICSSYGFTEGGMAWGPCHENSPLHGTAPDQCLLEVLDVVTHERVADGESGVVALTHLNRRGMPLLRYLLGDIAALTYERCPDCGRGGESLIVTCGSAHVTRTNGLIKIKGVLVNPECIHDIVMNIAEILEYQIALHNRIPDDPDSGDRLVLTIALDAAHPIRGQRLETWIADIQEKVFNASEIHPEVAIIKDPSLIYDPERNFKARRLVDQRASRE